MKKSCKHAYNAAIQYACYVNVKERQMDLTPLKRALVSRGLPMTYKVHNQGHPGDVGYDNTPPQRN
jgi:hypothetical protein